MTKDDREEALSALLRSLPVDVSPSRDLMPGIAQRIADEQRPLRRPITTAAARSRALARWSRLAAAAALLFTAGWAAGRRSASSSVVESAPAKSGFGVPPGRSDPLTAATEVQRTGTAYIAALGHLARTVDDESIRAQGREADQHPRQADRHRRYRRNHSSLP